MTPTLTPITCLCLKLFGGILHTCLSWVISSLSGVWFHSCSCSCLLLPLVTVCARAHVCVRFMPVNLSIIFFLKCDFFNLGHEWVQVLYLRWWLVPIHRACCQVQFQNCSPLEKELRSLEIPNPQREHIFLHVHLWEDLSFLCTLFEA